jgi:hypothetical protein
MHDESTKLEVVATLYRRIIRCGCGDPDRHNGRKLTFREKLGRFLKGRWRTRWVGPCDKPRLIEERPDVEAYQVKQ